MDSVLELSKSSINTIFNVLFDASYRVVFFPFTRKKCCISGNGPIFKMRQSMSQWVTFKKCKA